MLKMESMQGPRAELQKNSPNQGEIEMRAKLVMNNLGLKAEDLVGKKILDLGAGKAELAQWAKSHGINIVSLDNGIGYTREEMPKNVNYIKGSAEVLPIKDDVLDLIVSHGSPPGISQEKQEVIKIIKEAVRVLKNGGEFRFGPGRLHPAVFDLGELFTEEEEKNLSTEDRIQRIREKSLEFLRSIYPNIEEISIEGKADNINGFFYLLKKSEIKS
jgi:ubiquinone/menaquinone biosynthesis C-methylase UbiE